MSTLYCEDSVTKTHDGGLKDIRREYNVVWVFSSENQLRHPVRIVEKLLSLCPPVQGKNNIQFMGKFKFNEPKHSKTSLSSILQH